MTRTFRVVDTGLREGRYNIALDQAMIQAHQAGQIPDTIRFIHFPPTALVGRHQALGQEINLAYCRSKGIGLARRITGGGAIYLDPGQLGWGLVFHRRTLGLGALGDVAREICQAVATGLGRLGVQARYRPRNDIEVDGRKISGTGGFFDGDTLIYQGTVLVDMDPAEMTRALNIPAAKLARRGLESGAQRVVTLKELLGGQAPPLAQVQDALLAGFRDHLGLAWEHGSLSAAEESLAQSLYDEEIGRDEFVAEIDDPATEADWLCGAHQGAGGLVTAFLRLEGPARNRVGQLLFTGDFFVAPPRVVFDLEAGLRGVAVDDAAGIIHGFFREREVGVISVTPGDFLAAFNAALVGGNGRIAGDRP